MFTHLLRRLADTIDRARASFLSEPVALAASDPSKHPVREYDLTAWLKLDDNNRDEDAIAGIDRYSDGKEYAVIVTAGSRELVVIDIDGRRQEFIKAFLDEKATRSVLNSGIREARFNPPPPPPPPGRPPWELIGRLDGLLRVGELPVVKVESLTRGGLVG
jgi:hypothetical protein